jgi:hypothetical protein
LAGFLPEDFLLADFFAAFLPVAAAARFFIDFLAADFGFLADFFFAVRVAPVDFELAVDAEPLRRRPKMFSQLSE